MRPDVPRAFMPAYPKGATTMSTDHNATNGVPKRFTPPRSTDERGRLLPITDEQRRAMAASWDETVRELEGMTDETDTPELWDEVLRNLGVDPATGRGLKS
jgi:hypothetical protein